MLTIRQVEQDIQNNETSYLTLPYEVERKINALSKIEKIIVILSLVGYKDQEIAEYHNLEKSKIYGIRRRALKKIRG